MLLNCNGSVSREGENQSVFSLHRFRRLSRISWRYRGPWRIDGDEHIVRGQNQHRRVLLERLPFELLHMILLEACIDGGRTGCSLSLVSKDVRTLSRATRFHSVSLLTPSLWKLQRFLQEYDKARDAAIRENAPWTMPRVRHLCLLVDLPDFLSRDSLDVKPAKQDSQHPEYSSQRRFRNHLLDKLRGRRHDLPPDELTIQILQLEHDYRDSAVVTLLEQVAGDLFSLCLYQFPHLRGTRSQSEPPPCVPVSSFPNLRALWLGGKDERGASLFLRDTSFPALKRLHMRAAFNTDVLHWLSAAPRLDSLRIVAGPKLLTVEEGQQTFMGITAHPIWREKGKHLTILVPLKRKDSFGWSQFGQRASLLRQVLAEAARPMIFVPYYATQDVDGRVRRAVEGRRRFWSLAWDHRKPAAQDELFRRDWLARVDGRCDGIYVQDFWAHYVGDGEGERKRIEENMRSFSWEGPAYVAPLIIQPEAV